MSCYVVRQDNEVGVCRFHRSRLIADLLAGLIDPVIQIQKFDSRAPEDWGGPYGLALGYHNDISVEIVKQLICERAKTGRPFPPPTLRFVEAHLEYV